MTYVLLLLVFWLGMLVERHFIAEVVEAPPAPPPAIGDLYWHRFLNLRFRVTTIHGDAVVLVQDPPGDYITRTRTATILNDGSLEWVWIPDPSNSDARET